MFTQKLMRSIIALQLVSALAFSLFSPALPVVNAGNNPSGNNGTIKIDSLEFDSHPNNQPHVGCTFQIDFYNFDQGNFEATVMFEMQGAQAQEKSAPNVTSGDLTPFIGGDPADNTVDAQETYTLDFTGITPHPQQGYHVKVTIHAQGWGNNPNNDTKSKVFWVENCTPPTGNITIIKDAQPDSRQNFKFKLSSTENNFNEIFKLDDDNNAKLSNTKIFSNLPTGSYEAFEYAATGWVLTNITCTGDSDSVISLDTKKATINLSKDENVVCTFVNQPEPEYGTITIVKNTTGGDGTFNFTSNIENFSLTTVNGVATQVFTNIAPGNYSISEIIPDGWILDAANCSDQSPVNAIDLQANESITCTFINTKKGTIIIEKQTIPDGDSTEFTFDPSWSNTNFVLADGQQHNSGYLHPAFYSVSEIAKEGWAQASIECSDQSQIGQINLQAGETVTCVFTNTYIQPTYSLEIVKLFCANAPLGANSNQFLISQNTAVFNCDNQSAATKDVQFNIYSFNLFGGADQLVATAQIKASSLIGGMGSTTVSGLSQNIYKVCEVEDSSYETWVRQGLRGLIWSDYTNAHCIYVITGITETIQYVNRQLPTPTTTPEPIATPTPPTTPTPTPTPGQVLGEQVKRPQVLATVIELPSTGADSEGINLIMALFFGAVFTRRRIS